MIIAVLAWSGAILSCLLSIPQAVQTLRSDRLEGVSAATYRIMLANAAVWATWAVLTGEYAAGVPALVNGPAAMLILRRLHRIQRPVKSRRDAALRSTRAGSPVRPSPALLVAEPCQ